MWKQKEKQIKCFNQFPTLRKLNKHWFKYIKPAETEKVSVVYVKTEGKTDNMF